jgi:hypothetical protein
MSNAAIFQTVGVIAMIVGVLLSLREQPKGEASGKAGPLEFKVTTPSLLFFLVGSGLFCFPFTRWFIKEDATPPESQSVPVSSESSIAPTSSPPPKQVEVQPKRPSPKPRSGSTDATVAPSPKQESPNPATVNITFCGWSNVETDLMSQRVSSVTKSRDVQIFAMQYDWRTTSVTYSPDSQRGVAERVVASLADITGQNVELKQGRADLAADGSETGRPLLSVIVVSDQCRKPPHGG